MHHIVSVAGKGCHSFAIRAVVVPAPERKNLNIMKEQEILEDGVVSVPSLMTGRVS